jgi:hypothetical protein
MTARDQASIAHASDPLKEVKARTQSQITRAVTIPGIDVQCKANHATQFQFQHIFSEETHMANSIMVNRPVLIDDVADHACQSDVCFYSSV